MKKFLFVFVALSVVIACGAVVVSAADAAHGKEVYTAQKCQLCHAIAGAGNKAHPLDGVGTKLNTDQIKKWIVAPKEADPKTTMKAYPNLPQKDLDDLIAYMESLKK